MKKMLKRVFAVVLTLIMLVTAVPVGVFAVSTNGENGEMQTETYAEGANSVGNVLADEIQKVQADAAEDATAFASITALELTGFTATVEFSTDVAAKLVVAIFTEDGKQMLTSGMTDVTTEKNTATVNIKNAALPDYYLVRAFLLDTNSNAALCDKFTDDTHTKAYKDFMATSVSDFDADKVIQLDDNQNTNFIVVSDSAENISGTQEVNTLVSADYDTSTYIFKNIDSSISSLKVGDIFYFQSTDGQYELIKVKSIKIDGTTATIISDEMDIEEAFEFVKIDSADFEEPDTESDEFETMAVELTPDSKTFFKGVFTIDLRKNTNGQLQPIINSSISVGKRNGNLIKQEPQAGSKSIATATANVTLKATLKLYLSLKYSKVEFTVDGSAGITIDSKIEFAKTMQLGDFNYDFCKFLVVGVKLNFKVEITVEIHISGTLTFKQGIQWSTDNGFERINPKPNFKAEVKIDGNFYIGFELVPYLNVAGDAVADVDVPINLGVRIKATLYASNVADPKHDCMACLSGDITGEASLSAMIVLFRSEDLTYTLPEKTFTAKITDFYYSITHNSFGWTTCPYNKNTSGGSSGGSSSGGSSSGGSSSGGSSGDSGNEYYDIIKFGSYPQSEVTNSVTLSALNSLSLNWKSYGYYSGTGSYGTMEQGDWMQYADTTYNGSKYRAVKFTQQRPYYTYKSSSSSNSYQDENGYTRNTIYWFKYEPLKWRVLDPNNGLVLCETIIDSQPYSNTIYQYGKDGMGYTGYWNNASHTNYANDYATSSIREWLNDDFYNTAFSSNQKKNILSTTLDNSCPWNSKYDSASTTDKVFLLSYDEVRNTNYGFSSGTSNDEAREAQGSDYAKCQGLYVYTGSSYKGNSYWWLRSPGYHSYSASIVLYDGYVSSDYNVSGSRIGVRPALKISNLSSKISTSSDAESGTTYIPAEEEFETFDTETVDITTGTQKNITADSCIGGMYSLLNVLNYGNDFELSADNLLYIDVLTADENGSITTEFTPMYDSENAKTLLIGDFEDDLKAKNTSSIEERGYINFIYGLEPKLTQSTFESSYVDFNNVKIDYSLTSDYLSTGSLVTVSSFITDEVINDYAIVIFGDVNCDGIYDGQDAIIVTCLASGMLTENDVGEAAYMAADANHDDVVNDADIAILNEAGLMLTTVAQSG